MIKTTPMIFNTEMVRALLAGNKTQTRRIVKPQPNLVDQWFGWIVESTQKKNEGCAGWITEQGDKLYAKPPCNSGDLIYVRETWYQEGFHTSWSEMEPEDAVWNGSRNVKYFASTLVSGTHVFGMTGWRKRPSIHMPRWASRLTLKINSVRVERIQDISKDDAIAEGFDYSKSESATKQGFAIGARTNFHHAWKSIYGDSWGKNEWVWVIDFEVIHKNIDLVLAEMEQTS